MPSLKCCLLAVLLKSEFAISRIMIHKSCDRDKPKMIEVVETALSWAKIAAENIAAQEKATMQIAQIAFRDWVGVQDAFNTFLTVSNFNLDFTTDPDVDYARYNGHDQVIFCNVERLVKVERPLLYDGSRNLQCQIQNSREHQYHDVQRDTLWSPDEIAVLENPKAWQMTVFSTPTGAQSITDQFADTIQFGAKQWAQAKKDGWAYKDSEIDNF